MVKAEAIDNHGDRSADACPRSCSCQNMHMHAQLSKTDAFNYESVGKISGPLCSAHNKTLVFFFHASG